MQSTGNLEIAELVVETISRQHRNRFPLPNAQGAPAFRGRDVTTFLHKYESLAAFTSTDVTESSVIAMLPYYCTEEIRETVMMMRGYTARDWAALKKELLIIFRHADSRALIYTRQHLEQLSATFRDSYRGRDHADFGGLDQMQSLKSFLRTYDHISGVITEHGMICEYERTEMLLRALPKRLWRKAVTKLGMHPLEPSTFDYGKLHSWVTAKITAAEALAMFEFMAPKSPAVTEMTPSTSPALTTSASTTPSASLTSASMTAPTASTTPMASASPAPTDMTAATPTASTAPTTSPAPTAPTAFTPPARTQTARQGTIRAGPTVRLGIIRVEPPQGQNIRRHHYAPPEPIRPHRTESTVTCRSERAPSNHPKPMQPHGQEPVTPNRQDTVKLPRSEPIVPSGDQPEPSNRPKPMQPHGQEPAPPNRQEPVKLPRSEPIVPSHNQPVPPYRQEAVQPPPCQEPVQPPQQVDRPPCYYCADDQHNLRKCTDLRTDLGIGIVSINNRDRLVLGTAGGEIPLEPAHRDYRTIKDYACAGAPILSAPSPAPAPSPASQPAPPPPPPPAQSSRTSVPLLSLEQLTQLMREVTEHFAQSRQHEVVQEPLPPPAELSRTSVPLPSPEQLTQLVQEVTEHFAQPRPRQTTRPPSAARKARMLEQQRRSLCV
ncbi:hypothetical protein K440DRAFT_681243 [Wilcoxina mikolae CBS 423.85]|nr:hypothetical protein K440DRAFT_681243 [Wilcoxina mikolae CBS 423.85]